MASIPEYLFAYGTLRSGQAPHAALMAEHFTLLGKAAVQGQLFEIAGYPGMLLSADSGDRVIGELYRLDGNPDVWHNLDAYEGCGPGFVEPHEFVRRQVSVWLLAEARWFDAWAWLYNWPPSAERRILSGDYNAPRPADAPATPARAPGEPPR